MQQKVRFGIIGGGWRTEYFLQIASALPDRFSVEAVMVRNAEKGQSLQDRFGVRIVSTLDELLAQAEQLDFVIVCVSWDASAEYIRELVRRHIPVLGETPPAPDEQGLRDLYAFCKQNQGRVQVAEQYQFQPLHSARLHLARSGKIGAISQAQISVAHGYHGVNLIRQFLGVNYEDCTIQAQEFTSPLVETRTFAGVSKEERIVESQQTLATLRFGDKLGVFDFTDDQYFSWIRNPRILVRGERGEISGESITYLSDFLSPVTCDLRREAAGLAGNLEGFYIKGITCAADFVYRNPFIPGRLTDDELAGATTLWKMGEYAHGGPEFYSLSQAAQDHYLFLQIKKAVASGEPVRTERQPWSL